MAGDVIQQGVEPDPDRELRVERHPDAPFLIVPRDVDVLQAALHQGEDFVAAALRLDEVGILLVETQQLVLELRQGEEMARLAAPNGRRLVDRAKAFVQVLLRLERFAAFAVPAFVGALVDVAVVEDLLDELLAAAMVARLAGLDEVVVS